MKLNNLKLVATVGFVSLLAISRAFAHGGDDDAHETPSPSASATASASPTTIISNANLVCSKNELLLSIKICGVHGCPALINNGTTETKYNFTRKKNSSGALTYTTKGSTKPKCTVVISPLKKGRRAVQNASCAKNLVGATCKFETPLN